MSPRRFAAGLVLLAAGWLAGFSPPAEQERLRALGNLFEETEVVRRLLTPDSGFSPIARPQGRDWLVVHEERGQTFEDYRDTLATRREPNRRIICLQPIGVFSDKDAAMLATVRDYAAAFFQLEVRLLPAHTPAESQFSPRNNPRSGQQQILTTAVLDFLKPRLPTDAACLLAITLADLYPDPGWNYVFGQASLHDRVGVYSFARYDPAFWGEAREAGSRSLQLQRACKVLAHETGHMFGLEHCIHFSCVMNGANHLVEADAQPQHLCPVCLRKLMHGVGFDPVRRYRQLAEFYRAQDWPDETRWVERQLAKAGSGKANP